LRCGRGFLPVVLFEAPGKRVSLPAKNKNGRTDWLLIEDDSGLVAFRTTKGLYLRVKEDGECAAAVLSEDEVDDREDLHSLESASMFHLLRVSDFTARENDNDSVPDEALWMLESASHGTFLTLDSSSHLLHCSKTPAFWKVSTGFALTCTIDTPPRRRHYRKQWETQTVEYVTRMRERYLSFSMHRMSLRGALDYARKLPSYYYGGAENSIHTPSLRTRCFRTAELFRNAGHPDWVQLLALAYALGGVLKLIDVEAAIASEGAYDWTIPSRARVVGCASPDSVSFAEFRTSNADERDPHYSTPHGIYETHCGFENVMLSWTGPEYMYLMLKHNDVNVPNEGFKMLRLASLYEWHSDNAYQQFADDDDEDVRSFVADFDELMRTGKEEAKDANEMSTEECDRLWSMHYADIAIKYGADGNLMW
jgi:inositol oxygenase